MDDIERTSRQLVVRCDDCGSVNVRVYMPDGTVGYFARD